MYNFLQDILDQLPSRPFKVQFPDGRVISPKPDTDSPDFTFVLVRPSALRRMFLLPSELAIGEGYIFGDYKIEGDLVSAFHFFENIKLPRFTLGQLFHFAWQLIRLERANPNGSDNKRRFAHFASNSHRHTVERDTQAAQFIYDLSNDFYKLWLDDSMSYSCAYFADANEALETAQRRKHDQLCRKLNLRPGERLLDIGCGWGGLIIHAVKEYGAVAIGITLSEAQRCEAMSRIEASGISDRCQVFVHHYEQFETDRPFDKIVSVGMFEHVGDMLDDYFAKVYELLRPGGLFMLQGGYTRMSQRRDSFWMDLLGIGRKAFFQKYILPDDRDIHLVDIATVLKVAEESGFETRDTESLREHYSLTFRHWLMRLQQNRTAAIAEVGEVVYRIHELMLAVSLYLMDTGKNTEYQTLFAKSTLSGQVELPLKAFQ